MDALHSIPISPSPAAHRPTIAEIRQQLCVGYLGIFTWTESPYTYTACLDGCGGLRITAQDASMPLATTITQEQVPYVGHGMALLLTAPELEQGFIDARRHLHEWAAHHDPSIALAASRPRCRLQHCTWHCRRSMSW